MGISSNNTDLQSEMEKLELWKNNIDSLKDATPRKMHEATDNNKIEYCYTCGGHGFRDKDCPECGRKAHSLNLTKNKPLAQKLVTAVGELRIPNQYTGITWSYENLLDTHQELENNQMFVRWAKQLEKIHAFFEQGILPPRSALIIAPPQMSKVTFAYSCMQFAIAHELKVAPMLDSMEVKRLLVLAAERPTTRVCGVDYEEYINSDIVFITITKTTYREEAYAVIQEVLDKRSRRGLPTFFISRYDMKTLAKRDWEDTFTEIQDFRGTENPFKYPAIISFWSPKQTSTKGV